MVDLVGLYRVFNPKYKNWTIFGQDFLAQHLLGWDTRAHSHDAVGDAIKSVQLFNLHQQLSAAGGDALAKEQVGPCPVVWRAMPCRAVLCCAVLCCLKSLASFFKNSMSERSLSNSSVVSLIL